MKFIKHIAASSLMILCIMCKAYGQSDTSSTVTLRGYVVRQSKKQEVANLATNNQNGIIPIDSYLRAFFLPFGTSPLDIATDSLNILNRNRIVFLPSAETNELITTYCKDKTALINKKSITYDAAAPYYQINRKKDAPYLYQYYFMDCQAIKTVISNTVRNCLDLNIPYNKSSQPLTCYFIYDVVVLQPIFTITNSNITLFNSDANYPPHEAGHLKDH